MSRNESRNERRSVKEELADETPEAASTVGEETPTTMDAKANSDEIVEPPVRENVKDYVNHVLVVEWVNTEPVASDEGVINVSRIDGIVVDDEGTKQILDEYKRAGKITEKIKNIIKEHGTAVKLYSTSKGVYNSLLRGIIPQLAHGKVIVYIREKKSDYPIPTVLLDPLKVVIAEMNEKK